MINIKSEKSLAYLCLVITFFCWGSVYVANGYILRELKPMELACIRFLIASLAIFLMLKLRRVPIRLDRKDLRTVLLISGLGYYLSMECTLLGVAYAGGTMSSLINSLNPVFITFFAFIFIREAISRRQIICLLIALAGVYLISAGDTGSAQIIGILFGLTSVITWAATSLIIRRLAQKYDPMLLTFFGITGSLLFHIPTAAVTILQTGSLQVSPVTMLFILYSAVMGTAVPQVLWSAALSRLKASSCSMFYPLQPIFSALLGILIFREVLTARFFCGGIIILASVAVSCLSNHSPLYRRK